ncbi:MAG: ATP-binding protein [Chloroflexi bacterium]|nr:ATP-binding protein [Chloroflexota bacterium]
MLNPYEGYSGLPVTGPTFVGRNDILRQIETRWAVSDRLPPLILYGHRRMGKSSIVRNLGRGTDSSMILVYLDMQDAGWVDHTGQLLLDFAEAIYRKASEAVLDAGPAPVEGDYADLGVARRALNSLLDRLDGQMADRRLILAVDEFEIIQQGIEKGRIDPDLLHYLRSKASQYRWLALIFAGLHTLDEMGHDYRSAFYGAAEHVRVGYLSHDDALQLITQPHPDFSLEYAPELREELFHLTYGQPYLLQRLCWELVNRWNERFLRGGEATLRELTMDDLAPILTPDFYEAAGYYFDGVWSNVTEAERGLMRALAIFGSVGDRPEQPGGGWTAEGLVAATGQTPEAVSVALDLLRRHDVIVEEAGGVRFASELMRRWVAQYQ